MYRFFVVASDCGLPPQKATAQVMVNITDENDNVPQFEEDFIIVHILENTVPGTAIADLMAVDLDSGDYGTVVYGIESNDDARLPFTVNATNGQVIVSSLIDYELKNSYHFCVTARNPGESTQAYANVEVIVDSQNEFKPKFLTAKQNFEVSSRALKGTIIGKVSAVDLDEGRHGRIIYATPINNIAEISAASGEILVKSMLNGSLDKTVLEVVAMNVQLTRFDREMPHRMTVEVVRKDVPPTPLLLKHYAFNLSEEAQLSTRLKLLSPSVLPSGVRLEILNGGFEQPFCSEQGMASLRLCGPLDHERTAKHEFEVALIRDSRTLSQSKVTVSILESNNNTLPRIDIDTAVGFIRENSPASSTVTRLRPIIQGPAGLRQAFTYRIMDTDLAKIFAVDESTAVMNTAITLDREIRSQYVIPISISAVGMPSISTTYNVRVYVDDARDNMAEMGSRLVIVEKTIADDGENNVDSIEAIHILPRCRDEVSSTDFICETRNNGTKVMVSSNCKVQLNREVPSETTLSLEAYDRHYLSNVTFFSLIKQRAVDAFIYNNSVSVDVWAMLASIADMVDLLQESVPDMTVRLVGVEHFGLDSYRLLMAVFDRNGAIVTADETARMLKHFYSKKNVELNVFVRALMADICAMPDGCLNGGVCQQTTSPTRQYQQLDGYKSSFVIPIVKRRRRCLCKRLTNGERCELKTEMCSAKKPCVNGGICDPYSGLCSCSPSYTGTHCEEDVNECTQKNICGGGQCINMPGSFKCVCPLGFTGSRCETRLDLCDSVLCISGKCVNDENGASRCECNSGYQGHSCELRSRAFDSGSYMEIRLPPVSNEISLEFKTFASSALLLYSYSEGNLNDFAVVDIIKGRIRFSVRLDDITIVNIVLNGTVNDGMWKRVRLEQKWHTIRMTVEECTDDGYCQPCEKAICSRLEIMRTSYLWIASKTAFVGGIKNIEDVIKRPNQISSIDFVGCLRRFEVDGVSLERLETLSEAGLTMGCPSERQTCQIGRMIAECMNGVCMRDERGGAKCVCADGFDAASCRHSMEEWTLNGGEVRFALTQYVRRQISFVPVQEADLLTSDGMIRRRRDTLRDIPCEEMDYTEGDQLDGVVTQWAELDFRTTANYGTVFAIVEESKSSHMKIENGSLHFVTYLTDANPIDVHLDDKINDGKWHRLGFQIGVDQKTIRFQLDGHGKEIHADEEFPALISRSLSFVSIGVANEAEAFTGCVRRFILNNQAQSFNVNDDSLLAEQLLRIVSVRFISSGCGTPVRFSSASLQWHDVWTIVGVILAVIAICLTSLAAWLSWRRCGHKCGWRSKVQQQRNNLRLFSVSTDSMHAGQKHSNYSTSHRQIPSPWLYASMSAVQALQEIYSVGHPSRNGSSGLGSSGNTPSEDGYQNIERSMQVETTQTIRSRQHASESKSSVSRQLKAALRQSESSLRDSALPASSSECSYEELPSRRRRRRSRRKRDTYTNASYSVSPNETGIGMSDPAVRQTRVPRMETERDDCTRSSGVGSESCTTIINRPLSDTESDTTIAAQVPRSLAAFRAPRSVFADSDSSMEGNQRMDAIIGYGRPPTYV
ncbi:Protocadherin Fat 4 [Toxocara canis]|uniref:Protocadherin Fat 4 n=1 Tax=Toxocara canis TaxID=6265 RepID=A0A0B2VKB5_TOXCA|nr:Protocadherin Fat 4 [Toxocara canis]